MNEELKRIEKESHNKKLEEVYFISPILIFRKNDGSNKLALDSKLLNDQIFKNEYQMRTIHELIDNIALQLLEKSNCQVWLSNLEQGNAYSAIQVM